MQLHRNFVAVLQNLFLFFEDLGAMIFIIHAIFLHPAIFDFALSFSRGQFNKIAVTFDLGAWLRGPISTVLERELEQDSRSHSEGLVTLRWVQKMTCPCP